MKNGILKKISAIVLGSAMALGIGVAASQIGKGAVKETKADNAGTAIYSVSTTSSVTTTGVVPEGSTVSYSSTYGTVKQLTGGNSMTLSLSGYAGCKITSLTLSMKSNSGAGAGSLSFTDEAGTIASISDAKFNTSSWYGSWSTSYVNVDVDVDDNLVLTGDTAALILSASANSLYCQTFTIEWEKTSYVPTSSVYKTAIFNTSTYGNGSNNYTSSFVNEYKSFQVTVTNGNTNGKSWSYVKFGRKTYESVGTVTTNAAIDKPIEKVTITIDAITADYVNSIKLYTSSTTTFGDTPAGTFEVGTGKKTVTLSTPTNNLYYKIEFDCKAAPSDGSNGFITLSRVDYEAFDANAFANYFNDNIGCDVTGASAPTGNWSTFTSKYGLLVAADKTILKDATYTKTGSGEQTIVTPSEGVSEPVAQAMAKYDWIVATRGTTDYPNFINRTINVGGGSNLIKKSTLSNNNVITIVVIASSILAITTLGALLLLKKKKEQ